MTDFQSNRADWPAEGQIFKVSSVTVAVGERRHPFDITDREPAARNWAAEIAANPALFDGQMVLQHRVRIDGAAIATQAYLVPFSTFLWWRKTRPEGQAFHLFALPVLVSSDGAVIAIRMAQSTANPGRVYCAAGSLDAGDIVDGFCDLDANMAREVAEETGLHLGDAVVDETFHALHNQSVITLFKRYRFAFTAGELVARIAAHITADPEPEIDEALAIRDPDPARHHYTAFMPPILDWVFRHER